MSWQSHTGDGVMSVLRETTVAFLALAACLSCIAEKPESRSRLLASEVCDVDSVQAFVVECAEAANPLSDEEGEDLVVQCTNTALALHCDASCAQGWGDSRVRCF